MKHNIPLLEVDQVKITVIMDNTVDALMASSKIAHRFRRITNSYPPNKPIAEHGFSALIEVKCGDKTGRTILDTGTSINGILYNIDGFKIDLTDINAIILSHGHMDHTLGLMGLINRMESQKFSVICHPDVFLERKNVLEKGHESIHFPPKSADLRRENIKLIETKKPTLLSDNMILVSGEIDRTVEFEKGSPTHYTKRNGGWEPDPLIRDDQCVIVKVRGKGLVIITGCAHSGVINTIQYAQSLTNINQVHAVLGGFHLTGGTSEKNIQATVSELQQIKPVYIMPGHCTGWQATHKIANALPEAFIPNNVGTTLVFKS